MGYPMTYGRVVSRSHLRGDYGENPGATCSRDMIAGDLRRLEIDQRDEIQLRYYAAKVGITEDQVRAVLDIFFEGDKANPIEVRPYPPGGGWVEKYKQREEESPICKGEPAEIVTYWYNGSKFVVQTNTDAFEGFRDLVAQYGFPYEVYCRRPTRMEGEGQDGLPDQVQTDRSTDGSSG